MKQLLEKIHLAVNDKNEYLTREGEWSDKWAGAFRDAYIFRTYRAAAALSSNFTY